MTLSAHFALLPALPMLEARWQSLEARGDAGFFLGWTWIGSWLEATGARPELLSISDDGVDVALALVGRSMAPRLLGRTATLWLNQAGEPGLDRAFIEYNGLLTASAAPDGVAQTAMRALVARNDWRVLRLSGLRPDSPLLAQADFRRRIRVDMSPAYYVDLDAVRGADGDYLALLSANSRSQIKRAAKDYDGDAVATAAWGDEIPAWLDEMQALNAGRHDDNAWEDPVFRRFAELIAKRGHVTGEVELLRIDQGGHLLGFLLNFVKDGVAMNYQSAFAPPLSAKGKPGLLAHAAAVARYAQAGLTRYSLLAGKDRYKQSLSTGSEELEWWAFERFSPRLEAEALLRRVLRRPAGA
jgi:hypothetical protein